MSFAYLLLFSQCRLSSVSVVFDFNDSLNDVAPVSPMMLPVGVERNEKQWIVCGCICLMSSFFCFHHLDRVS